MPDTDRLLINRVRAGQEDAWQELIDRYEGRLLAFVESRVGRRDAEDLVQDTFIGFLTSLPNYDAARPLESYLFSIAAHKLTDYLRRAGRRPTLSLSGTDGQSERPIPSPQRRVSSAAMSGERRALEAAALAKAMADIFDRWRQQQDFAKIECQELLLVRGMANKDVATRLGLTEQQVANQKFEFLTRLRAAVKRQGLSEEVFPELYEDQQ
jgi:RNA polymerase sigma-70 factor (ECF subfamily)